MDKEARILKMKLDAALTRINAFNGQVRMILTDPTRTDHNKIEAIDALLRAEDHR